MLIEVLNAFGAADFTTPAIVGATVVAAATVALIKTERTKMKAKYAPEESFAE
jgi:hypothetical protein